MSSDETVRVYGIPSSWYEDESQPLNPDGTPQEPTGPTRADCVEYDEVRNVTHTERIWWMLPLNPFVVVADAAPSDPTNDEGLYAGFTPMRWISAGARMARTGETGAVRQECYVGELMEQPADPMEAAAKSAAVWPFGLGFLLLSGAGATALANRRLRTPVRRLPNGTRIA